MLSDFASWYDYCREHDDLPIGEEPADCSVDGCGDRADDHRCDTCQQTYCARHIYVIRPKTGSQITLEKICDACQEYRMAYAERQMLLNARDHQRENPFDARYAVAINRLFQDGIAYGVWKWEEAA